MLMLQAFNKDNLGVKFLAQVLSDVGGLPCFLLFLATNTITAMTAIAATAKPAATGINGNPAPTTAKVVAVTWLESA